uniref:repetitive organellar protein isoform X4 n=1 Tax=Vespula vulgaris TaxID=7454 RepID=UPI00223AA272|nr:repetitive organellar protein isoform X4 [Vespula vulgaris]
MPAPSSSAQAGVDRVSARQSGSRHPRERWDRCLPPLFFARSCTTDAPPPPSASTAYVKKKKQKKRKQCLTECPIRRIITVFFSLSVCLSVCPSICLFLSLYRSILCILFSLSIFLPLSASVCVSLYLSFSFTHILHFYIFLLLLSFSSISRVSLFLSLSIFSSSGKAEKDDVEETVEEEEEEKKKKKKKEKEKTTKKERKKRRRKEEKREDRRPKSEQGRGRRRRLRCPGGELARGWSTTCAIMAEVATKKSISVVSNKKNEVCGVQSNNGLIDLDNITATHNKQLISLCDNNDDEDDLVLTNNTRNELATEDKSLQELIENELALRICSNNGDKKKKKKKKDDDDDDDDDDDGDDDNDGNGDGDGDDEIDEVDDNNDIDNQDEKNRLVKMDEIEEQQTGQPDTVKRILLDRQEDQFRVNTDFIVAELEHCALIGEPYGYQNGHVSPITNVKPEDGANESKKEIVDFDKDKIDDDDDDDDDDDKDAMIMKKTNDEIERERKENEKSEEKEEGSIENENDLFLRSTKTNRSSEEVIANLDDVKFESDDNNVDVESNRSMEINISKVVDNSSPLSCGDKYQQEEEEEEEENKLIESKSFLKDTIELVETDLGKDECLEKKTTWTNEQEEVIMDGQQSGGQFSDNFEDPEQVALTSVINDKLKTIDTKESLIDNTTEYFRNDENVVVGGNTTNNESSAMIMDTIAEVTNKVMESPQDVSSNKSRSFDDVTLSQSETSTDAASTQEFIDMERRVLSEENESNVERNVVDDDDTKKMLEDDLIDRRNDVTLLTSYSNETTREFDYDETANDSRNERFEDNDKCQMSDSTVLLDNTEVVVSAQNLAIFSESKRVESLLIDSVDQSTDQAHKFDSWMTVEEATRIEEDVEIEKERHHEEILTIEREDTNETIITDSDRSTQDDHLAASSPRAPLATPDDETSDIINVCDSESREEKITTTSSTTATATTVMSSSSKGAASVTNKTKKKKIEGVAGNDASPNLTPRTKKTKKSKKSDLEKENISVNSDLQDASMHTGSRMINQETIDFSDEDDLSNVNVKSLTQNYVSEANRNEQERSNKERIATGVSIKQLCRSFGDISNMSEADQATFGRTNSVEIEEKAKSMGDLRVCEQGFSKFYKDAPVFAGVSVKALKSSFNKFDALSKKTVLHVRSVDAGKVQQQLNSVGQNGEANQNCRSCGKVVFQMEQTKAEGLVWHKNCFRCVQCSKQLNVDNYESHESTLYCKPHFKELFQPKPVEESDQSVRPRKPELIIRENEPKELPPDVVRASDKPDLGLEELSSLNVKSRFQVFEKAGTENTTNEIERSPSQIAVKRSPSILSKLAKFQAKGMDIGVADESLNGIPYEESSESEEEEAAEDIEEVETEIVKAKRTTRERPISFSKMDDIKNRWESTSQQGRREVQREARKEEIAGIRSRLFMGKQGKMKEMYQQAVAGSERVTKINAAEEIQHSTHARSIKERFERGEPIAASDDETDSKPKPEKADEEVIAAGISRKSRSLFLELDASAAKTGRPVTPVNPKTPADAPRRARDAFMVRQVSDDVVRSSDTTEEVHVETSDISNKFKFFESYKEPEKQRKQFRITPPRDGQVKQMDSPEREIYRDPDVVRADDRVDEVVHTDTARKMLSIFRQMEENACKEELPEGPKPLKRFTPPPEDKFAKQTASDSEEDEEEEGEESEADESAEERDPNYVRASDKVEDEFLKQAQNAARAKTLRAKFEHWEETDGKPSNHNIAEMEIAQSTGDQSSIESASSLRARFESLGSQTNESPRAPKIKVNRFVEIQASCTDVCESCKKKVYPLEKVETNNKIFHKQCFRCLQCNCVLRMDTFTLNNGKLYCIPHFKQLFITRGNYDEGFGVDPHKNKWATSNANQANVSPIAVSNGDL